MDRAACLVRVSYTVVDADLNGIWLIAVGDAKALQLSPRETRRDTRGIVEAIVAVEFPSISEGITVDIVGEGGIEGGTIAFVNMIGATGMGNGIVVVPA